MNQSANGPAIAALILSLLYKRPCRKSELVEESMNQLLADGILPTDVESVLRDLVGGGFVSRVNGEGECKLTPRGREMVEEALAKAGKTRDLIASG